MCQRPVRELQSLRTDLTALKSVELNDASREIDLSGQQLEIVATFAPGNASEFGFRVLKGSDQETVVGYEVKSQSLFVHRTRSGNVDFHKAFCGRQRPVVGRHATVTSVCMCLLMHRPSKSSGNSKAKRW